MASAVTQGQWSILGEPSPCFALSLPLKPFLSPCVPLKHPNTSVPWSWPFVTDLVWSTEGCAEPSSLADLQG
jgi:hypothetical protein